MRPALLALLLLLVGSAAQADGPRSAAITDPDSSASCATECAAPTSPNFAPPADENTPTPSLVHAVRAASPVNIDGDLSDEAWRTAPTITGLLRAVPVEEGPGFGSAVFKVLYDEDALYIGARICQPPGVLRAHISPRDDLGTDDSINVYLKPILGSDVGYFVRVNPLGIQRDVLAMGIDILFPTWDAVWQSAAQRYEDGYSVELRLPFRNLRFTSDSVQNWGIGFGVVTGSIGQTDLWPPFSSDKGLQLNQLAILQGMTGLTRGYKVDITPSLVFRYGGSAPPGQAFQFDDGTVVRLRRPVAVDPGLDVHVGVTSGITASFTFNPDFSQIEADTAQLNYNLRYPLLLQEKRPFFLQGLNYFDTPVSMLYTRAINDPVAGLKFSGSEGKFSVGVLSVVDQDPPPSRITWDPKRTQVPTSGFENLEGSQAITSAVRLAYDSSDWLRFGVYFADKQALSASMERVAYNDFLAADARLIMFESFNVTLMGGLSSTSKTDSSAASTGRMAPITGSLAGGFAMLGLNRSGRNLMLDFSVRYLGTGFRAETSDLARTGFIPLHGMAGYKFELNLPGLTWLEIDLVGNVSFDEATLNRTDSGLGPVVSLLTYGNTTLTGTYTHGTEGYNGTSFKIDSGQFQSIAHPLSWLDLKGAVWYGDRINYDPTNAFLGTALDATVGFALRPTSQLRTEFSLTNSHLFRPGGGGLQALENLIRLVVLYSFDSRWSIRLISQFDSFDQSLKSSLLLSYVHSPGTAVYLGYQDGVPTRADSKAGTDRHAFLKVAFRWL